jgi:hypothetical protein
MTTWRRSSYSEGSGATDCVECANLAQLVGVRDSKNPEGDQLSFTSAAWTSLLRRIKAGELDHPRIPV